MGTGESEESMTATKQAEPGSLADHVLIVGAPGTGKTLWAREQSRKVPVADWSRCETASDHFYRCAGMAEAWTERLKMNDGKLTLFRAPHHSISERGLMGSISDGFRLRPGEVQLAHGGVLFLDEVQEFPRWQLDLLVRVVRDRRVWLRTEGTNGITVPAEFRLIVAATPCPCGWRGHVASPRPELAGLLSLGPSCRCTAEQAEAHMGRLAPLRALLRPVPRDEWTADVQKMKEAGRAV